MTLKSKDFLMELLSTPSPSGSEMDIQKKWMTYTKGFADEIRSDEAGNAIAILNPEAEFKVLLAGHCDEIGFMITNIDDDGFLYFSKVGGISHKPAVGMKVNILGYNGKVTGVIGVNAEHHGGIKDKFEIEDLFIDCGAKSKAEMAEYIQVGDLAVYKREPEFLFNDRISARGLDNRTGSFIVAEVLKNLAQRKPTVGVYAVSTVSEETNMGGAYFAGSGVRPHIGIACDVTFSTDYPGINKNKHGEIYLDHGPVLAKGSPINYKINRRLEETAVKLDMNVQYELAPKQTGTDADKLRVTGNGVPIALVSLPLRYMHSPVEVISLKDIDDEIHLLTEMIMDLTGEENFKPLEE